MSLGNVTAADGSVQTTASENRTSAFDVHGFPREAALIGRHGAVAIVPEGQPVGQAPGAPPACANQFPGCTCASSATPASIGGRQ